MAYDGRDTDSSPPKATHRERSILPFGSHISQPPQRPMNEANPLVMPRSPILWPLVLGSSEEGVMQGADLTQGFIDYDSRGVREIQGAHSAEGGNAIDIIWMVEEPFIRQANAFTSEDDGITGLEVGIQVASVSAGAEQDAAA